MLQCNGIFIATQQFVSNAHKTESCSVSGFGARCFNKIIETAMRPASSPGKDLNIIFNNVL